MSKSGQWVGLMAVGLLSVRAMGAVNVATDFQTASAPSLPSYTPPYTVSTSDLINGMSPSASAGDFGVEISGGLPALTNGAYEDITQTGGAPDRTHGAFATAGGGSGTGSTVTYNLNTGASPGGYNLSNITVYGGWNDSGRDQQAYTVQYATVASPGTFVDLATVNFNPTVPDNTQTANRVIISETTLPFLATGVAAVRFNFSPSTENGYSGYAEIDVNGSAVPEPGLFGLIGALGAMGLGIRPRRGVR
ncbi:MAG TPA: hypothetical protein VH475_16475 [Tepidisphaeraceae bacterium]|jgi:hypothetical protein